MYYYDGYYNYVPCYFYNRPEDVIPQPQEGEVILQPHMVPISEIQKQLDLGRQNHCFKGYWAGREHTFILSGIDSLSGMVSIIENNTPSSVHHSDIVGLTYLGIQCPTSTTPPPPICRWVWTDWGGWQWICR